MVLCTGCNRPLPLMDATEDELAGWACAHCGAVYRAAIDPRSTEQERRQVVLLRRTRHMAGVRATVRTDQ